MQRARARSEPVRDQDRQRAVALPFRSIVLAALLAGILVSACQTNRPFIPSRVYLAVSITENGAPKVLVAGTELRLDFTVLDIVKATIGCNTISGFGGYDGDRLDVPGLSMTEMACDNARMAQDQWLFGVLAAKPRLVMANDLLTIDGGNVQITLREFIEPDMPLVGTTWTVSSVFSPGGDPNLPEGTVATLVFNADGTLDLDDGCNSGTGRWAAAGTGIVITNLGLTKKACAGDLGAVEDAILATLRAPAIEVAIDEDRLELRKAERDGISFVGS